MNINKNNIKSYVIRKSRMTPLQKRAYAEYSGKHCIPYEQSFIDFEKLFDKKNVIAEIGFGMGEATAEIADKNREKAFIGIEVHKPGVGKLLSEIEERELSNLKIIEFDAVEVFKNMIPGNSLDGINIFFPDPWPKKRHHKRRLIKTDFIELISGKIKPGGYLYIVTDWEEYAAEIFEVIEKSGKLINEFNDFADKMSWRPLTKFEKKGINKSHIIRELYYIKN